MNEEPRDTPSKHAPEDVDPSFLDVVEQIADGTPVDWESSLANTPAREEAVRQLQRLHAVLSGHREVTADARPATPSTAPVSPTLFMWGPLEVREKIGEGTFGEVFRAWDPSLGREVALKLRKPGTSGRSERRWLDEARRLARVRHPNVLVVYGADEHDGRAGIWTELLFGRTLEERMRRDGPMGAREAALIGTDLCSALAAVHKAGLIHGDIKTTNIMREGASLSETPLDLRATPRGEAGRIVLMDFGTATDRLDLSSDSAVRLYATPLTAAPEVLEGRDASAASDLYSLGVVLYRLVTERYPIEASTLDELRAAVKSEAHNPLRTVRPDLPAPFVQVIERALASNPAERFASAAEMERALAATLGASATRPHLQKSGVRDRVLGVSIAVAVLAVAGLVWRARHPQDAEHTKRMTIPATSKSPVEARLIHTFSGTEAEGSVGMVLDIADLNHDGFADYFVGAPHATGGHMYVYNGGPNSDDTPDLKLSGGDSSDQFGRCVCASGDVNGDGVADVLIGETQGATGPGCVHVYFGGQPFDTTADLVLKGEGGANRDHFGVRILTLDFNADGFDDIVVGAYFHDDWAGRAYLYYGGPSLDAKPDLILSGENRGDGMTNSMSSGDLNHDGYDDLVLAAYWNDAAAVNAGRVYVYYGGPSPDAVADFTFDGAAAGDEFGCAISSGGDFDGDGNDDLLVGAHLNAAGGYEVGSADVFRGGPEMDRIPDWSFVGEAPGDQFGLYVLMCDLSGDKIADVIVGAQMSDAGGRDVGRAYVFLGGRHPDTIPDVVLTGKAIEDNFGGAFVASRDTGDGAAELLIGAHLNDFGATNAGQAYVYRFTKR